ncbi:PD-(D/E)XK nuclease family protein [Plebeiibacterium sediminum]|uniref:PD-(D/E)XK nuclease family protein n=1 Tax=Plebeiibacterium sediminum TaxID=2992112 RepID=A0AAE3M2D8_9BACT|nr:PD-(D/E)XK nuclease family protein [Plebeiobacterium sediminum]MCW3785499.1 PD-(D/E)XK nuclease family protein [Plebeiobacterium sediminum]
MISKPNIFNFATSELSQDAILVWLLIWAESTYKETDNALHQIGQSLLQALLNTKKIKLSTIDSMVIKQQFYKIDIFIELHLKGKKIGIIIEDKVATSSHSNQLEVYLNRIKKLNYDTIVPIYLKTGFQSDFTHEIENGYHPFTLLDLLKVLDCNERSSITNNIFIDYYLYLNNLHVQYQKDKAEYEDYKDTLISKWGWWSWVGFFNDNKERFSAGTGVVPNPRENLLAFYFGGENLEVIYNSNKYKFEPYIDILFSNGNYKISYRLGVKNHPDEDKTIRDYIIDLFAPTLNSYNIDYTKPRFKKGKETIRLLEVKHSSSVKYHNDLIMFLDNIQKALKLFVSKNKVSL